MIGVDGEAVQTKRDLVEPFIDGRICRDLHGKLKLFLIQACRGSDSMHSLLQADSGPLPDGLIQSCGDGGAKPKKQPALGVSELIIEPSLVNQLKEYTFFLFFRVTCN